MVDFYVQQMLDEWLRDVLVAENEPEHNWIGNVNNRLQNRLFCKL